MHLSTAALSIIAIVGLILSIIAILLAVRPAMRPSGATGEDAAPVAEGVEGRVETHARALAQLQKGSRQLARGEKRLYELHQEAIQRIAVVRFDAFEDMGGRLSFSAALLDAQGDGIVITAINARQETRCYAKEVQGGRGLRNLSDEETQAIREAMSMGNGRPPARTAVGEG